MEYFPLKYVNLNAHKIEFNQKTHYSPMNATTTVMSSLFPPMNLNL